MERELSAPLAVQPGNAVSDDRPLVESLKRGEPEAFERLVLTYQHRIFSIALRMLGDQGEAEEAAQEVFLRIHRSVRDFRGEARLSTWLYAITARFCLNRLKSPARVRRAAAATLERIADGRPNPGVTAEASQLEAALHRAIALLPDEQRVVVILRDLHGLAYEEIAAALDLPLGTVRSRLHRARMELKARLGPFVS